MDHWGSFPYYLHKKMNFKHLLKPQKILRLVNMESSYFGGFEGLSVELNFSIKTEIILKPNYECTYNYIYRKAGQIISQVQNQTGQWLVDEEKNLLSLKLNHDKMMAFRIKMDHEQILLNEKRFLCQMIPDKQEKNTII